MRIVLDTNVLISACLKPQGLEARVIAMALAGSLYLCLTPEISAEYEEVFSRPKFAAIRAASQRLLSDLQAVALPIVVRQRITAASDDDDNRFLECAAAAAADYLVTGNLRHYPAEWPGTGIVNARRFLALIGCIINT